MFSELIYHPVASDTNTPEDVLNEAYLAERVLTSLDEIQERPVSAKAFFRLSYHLLMYVLLCMRPVVIFSKELRQ
jgi:hypothetical protein